MFTECQGNDIGHRLTGHGLAVEVEGVMMKNLVYRLLDWLRRPHLVEFDYCDARGCHHGRCYVRFLFGGEQQALRMLRSCGYTNIHFVP